MIQDGGHAKDKNCPSSLMQKLTREINHELISQQKLCKLDENEMCSNAATPQAKVIA